MIEIQKARKQNPLYIDWINGTVTNKVTLVQKKIKMIKVGTKHYAYVPKSING